MVSLRRLSDVCAVTGGGDLRPMASMNTKSEAMSAAYIFTESIPSFVTPVAFTRALRSTVRTA